MTTLFNKINQQFLATNKILIISHQKPDSDAIGSALALNYYLKSLGKESYIFLADQLPTYFDFLPGLENITADRQVFQEKLDLVVVLDSSNLEHTKVNKEELNGCQIINIDHHFSNDSYGDINYINDLASSTCEIIYKFLVEVKSEITRNMATCLLCGILGDTGGFSNSATTVDSIKISSTLINYGAKIYKINNQVDKNKTINGLRLWGDVLSRLQIDDESKIAFTYIKEAEYQKYKIQEEELDGLINFLNVITDVSISSLFKINGSYTKVSLRTTKDNIDVSKIAQFYGGGGHKKAAGFTLNHTLDERTCDFVSYLKNTS